MKIQVAFETDLSPEELHELLCKAIHEGDLESINALSDSIEGITLVKDVP